MSSIFAAASHRHAGPRRPLAGACSFASSACEGVSIAGWRGSDRQLNRIKTSETSILVGA